MVKVDKNLLLITVEKNSLITEWEHHTTVLLFDDQVIFMKCVNHKRITAT